MRVQSMGPTNRSTPIFTVIRMTIATGQTPERVGPGLATVTCLSTYSLCTLSASVRLASKDVSSSLHLAVQCDVMTIKPALDGALNECRDERETEAGLRTAG